MIDGGLIEIVPAAAEDAVWSQDDENGRTTLMLTPTGLAGLGIDGEPATTLTKTADRPSSGERRVPVSSAASTAAHAKPAESGKGARTDKSTGGSAGGGSTKQDLVIALLRRREGAGIPEMMEETSWQAHSVRGFISGALKKKLKLTVTSQKNEKTGERRYHIAAKGAK